MLCSTSQGRLVRHPVVCVSTRCDRLINVVRISCALARSAGVLVGLPSSRLSRHTCGGSSWVLAVVCLRHTVVVLGRGCGQNRLTLPPFPMVPSMQHALVMKLYIRWPKSLRVYSSPSHVVSPVCRCDYGVPTLCLEGGFRPCVIQTCEFTAVVLIVPWHA
jgi:hypothetical protein